MTRELCSLEPLDPEAVHCGLLAALVVTIAGVLYLDAAFGGDPGPTLRHGLFDVVSLQTTTGYASADFAVWRPAATRVLFPCMFLGGMAGSTTCSIKLVRWLVIPKEFRRGFFGAVHRRRFGRSD